jgi:hypothetical protein
VILAIFMGHSLVFPSQIHPIIVDPHHFDALSRLTTHLIFKAHNGTINQWHKCPITHLNFDPHTGKLPQESLILLTPSALSICANRNLESGFPDDIDFLLHGDFLHLVELVTGGGGVVEEEAVLDGGHGEGGRREEEGGRKELLEGRGERRKEEGGKMFWNIHRCLLPLIPW